MYVLRKLIVAILLVVLLPWGAYLRAMPDYPGGSVPRQSVQQDAAGSETARLPSIKCRKGLPASPCAPEMKALVSVTGTDRHDVPQRSFLNSQQHLLTGNSAPPALPPPRLV